MNVAAGHKRERLYSALHRLAWLSYERGDYQAAQQNYQESLALKRQLGDLWGTAASLNNLGIVLFDRGEYEQARAYWQQGADIRRNLGDLWGLAALINLGLIDRAAADYMPTQRKFQESLAICRQIGDQRGSAECNPSFMRILTTHLDTSSVC